MRVYVAPTLAPGTRIFVPDLLIATVTHGGTILGRLDRFRGFERVYQVDWGNDSVLPCWRSPYWQVEDSSR